MEAIAVQGVTTPATQNVVRVTTPRPRSEHDRIEAGDLVAFDAGVVAGGYNGEVARTYLAGDSHGSTARVQRLYQRWDELWSRLIDACQPGASGSALLAAYEAAGEELPDEPVARGLGLGLDEPVVLRDLPATAAAQRLDPGTVVLITGRVADGEVGEVIGSEAVVITPTGPQVLTSSPFWHRSRP
jgi:Xaa-Pro dipeptidase